MSKCNSEGFLELQKELREISKAIASPQRTLNKTAKIFVNDLLKLPKPHSKIRNSRHTHLVDTFAYKGHESGSVTIGWGKYYGRMVETGTKLMKAQPHLIPLWKRNEARYYKEMIKDFKLD